MLSPRQHLFLIVALLSHVCVGFAQQSQNMNKLSQWDNNALPIRSGVAYNDIWGYASGGSEYAIIGILDSILFFDVTDPYNIVEVDAIAGGARSLWRDMKSYSHYLYAVADQGGTNEGLTIIDMSSLPDSVHLVRQTNVFFSRAHNIFIDENQKRLYVAGSNTRSNGVIILDLSVDPEDPSQLSSVALNGGYIHDLYARNDTIYCDHGNNGFYVYDISDAASPVELGSLTSYSEQGYNHACWLDPSGDNIVFTDETHDRGVKTVSVSDLSNIHVRDIFRSALLRPNDTASIAHNPIIKGNKIYLSYYHDGIQIWDMSNPDSVFRLGYYDTEPGNTNYSGYKGAWGVYPLLPSGIILGSDVLNGLFVLEYVPGPLAYDDLSLSAYRKGEEVIVELESSLPLSSYEMHIQRSTARNRWKNIPLTPLKTAPKFARYIDKTPAIGQNLYRLHFRQKQGRKGWKYSDISTVFFRETPLSVCFHFTQQGDNLHISVSGDAEGRYHFILYHLQGEKISEMEYQFSSEKHSCTWNTAYIPATGLYTVAIIGDEPGSFYSAKTLWLKR